MYGKIFEQIYEGSLRMNWKAMVTFQQMIVLCSEDGTLDMTPQALHYRTGIPLDIIKDGIEILEQDDPESRTQNKNGKRIERLDDHRTWGWRLINHEYYKNLSTWEEKKDRARERKKKQREREKLASDKMMSQDVTPCHTSSHMSQYTDTDKDTNKKKNTKKKKTCVWPKDFVLTNEMKTYAVDKGVAPEKVRAFFDDFRNWAEAKGATYRDWNAAFRTRVGKAPEYGKQFLAPPGVSPKCLTKEEIDRKNA